MDDTLQLFMPNWSSTGRKQPPFKCYLPIHQPSGPQYLQQYAITTTKTTTTTITVTTETITTTETAIWATKRPVKQCLLQVSSHCFQLMHSWRTQKIDIEGLRENGDKKWSYEVLSCCCKEESEGWQKKRNASKKRMQFAMVVRPGNITWTWRALMMSSVMTHSCCSRCMDLPQNPIPFHPVTKSRFQPL